MDGYVAGRQAGCDARSSSVVVEYGFDREGVMQRPIAGSGPQTRTCAYATSCMIVRLTSDAYMRVLFVTERMHHAHSFPPPPGH
eukprot:6194225-Pleurochrysis_carterae.AAC.1